MPFDQVEVPFDQFEVLSFSVLDEKNCAKLEHILLWQAGKLRCIFELPPL